MEKTFILTPRRARAIIAAFVVVTLSTTMITLRVNAYGPTQARTSVVQRLARRLIRSGMEPPTSKDLLLSLENREEYLNKELTISFRISGGKTVPVLGDYHLRMSEHADWIRYDEKAEKFVLDERTIRRFVDEYQDSILPKPKYAVMNNVRSDGNLSRATVNGTPSEGYEIQSIQAAKSIMKALGGNQSTLTLNVRFIPAQLLIVSDKGTSALTLLSSGKSNFAKSPVGRKTNIYKALNEQVNGVVIPAGSKFSFNETLKGSSGWANALVIVNGKDLIYEPGGGICQAATTTFRAAVLAGLPIEKWANHSLFVHYYEEGGVGLDATIYPGKQDLSFVNDTGHDIVILSHAAGDDATVELFGVPDNRIITLEGPFFSVDNESGTLYDNKTIQRNQIAWKNSVTYDDGTVRTRNFISTYKALPKMLAAESVAKRAPANGLAPNER